MQRKTRLIYSYPKIRRYLSHTNKGTFKYYMTIFRAILDPLPSYDGILHMMAFSANPNRARGTVI